MSEITLKKVEHYILESQFYNYANNFSDSLAI